LDRVLERKNPLDNELLVISHLWWWINNSKCFSYLFLINQCLYINVGGSVWEIRSPFDISSSAKNSQCENIETRGYFFNRKKSGSVESQINWRAIFTILKNKHLYMNCKRCKFFKVFMISGAFTDLYPFIGVSSKTAVLLLHLLWSFWKGTL